MTVGSRGRRADVIGDVIGDVISDVISAPDEVPAVPKARRAYARVARTREDVTPVTQCQRGVVS